MANVTSTKIVRDGYRNAVALLTGELDTAATAIVVAPAITLAQFTANDPGYRAFYGFRIDTIKYSISDSITVLLYWNATVQQIMAPLYGRGKMDYEPDGGLQPANISAAGFNGSINLEVYNVAPAATTKQGYSILLEMTKLYNVVQP